MFRFENENYLWLLLLLPILALLYWLAMRWRKQALEKFGELGLVKRLMPDLSYNKQRVKFLLYLGALGFIIIALANPQVGSKLEKVKRQGVDVMIAMDVSKSMLAEDLSPNRMEVSKRIVSKLIEKLGNDRVGLIVFAGNAYLQMPLTIDYSAAKLFLKTINTDIVPAQGTALGQAIELAKLNFDQESNKFKAMVLITDGENHESGAVDMAEEAAEEGVIIHTLGIGSEAGAPIPDIYRGQKQGYKKDKQNNIVNSKLNDQILKEISEASNGRYFRVNGSKGEIPKIIGELQDMEKKDFEDRVFTDYEDQFQYFIAIALLLLLIEFFISERSRGWYKRFKLFDDKKANDKTDGDDGAKKGIGNKAKKEEKVVKA